MSQPTLINLPPPPSEPPTPSDMGPSTPNSGTTSLSALSTTAINDGHQGKLRPHNHRLRRRPSDASDTSTDTLAAERADRISRLAGFERVTASRPSTITSSAGHHNHPNPSCDDDPQLPSGASPGYFDPSHTQQQHPQQSLPAHLQLKERSTVGSASATGSSVGGRATAWSGSDVFDHDRLNDDDGVSSLGGFSDENASLVGFGEGANSTTSGPVSSAARVAFLSRQSSGVGSTSAAAAAASRAAAVAAAAATHPPQGEAFDDVRMVDGVTFDENVVDTTVRSPRPVSR
ncbi:hypothetical protein LOZ58_004387 [Ophidiomyces ophidiicola]|nr:hypothetical protein LOZ65_005332 [Ophidiomyces ophidiicola]KAI1939354.1 hypothetical protein LOZ66_002666 [Ophidiomyces ophidiicola]KAI1959578.1 hypothetical protein LOZ58_004387 [Ophidiomyces ophidiicola]